MTLRNDMPRCTGINLQDERGLGVAIAGNPAGHVDCIKCQRREPGTNEQQHWEGWIARRIVDALLADSVLEDAARYHYLRDVPMAEWPDELATAFRMQQNAIWDAAIDAARKQGANHD